VQDQLDRATKAKLNLRTGHWPTPFGGTVCWSLCLGALGRRSEPQDIGYKSMITRHASPVEPTYIRGLAGP
jgi:hypothetical protein